MKTQIMHSYLPPVDVELSIDFGGALDGQGDCRTITIQVGNRVTNLAHSPHNTSQYVVTASACALYGAAVGVLIALQEQPQQCWCVSRTLPSCYTFLLLQAAVLSESEATLVLDHKARGVCHRQAGHHAGLPSGITAQDGAGGTAATATLSAVQALAEPGMCLCPIHISCARRCVPLPASASSHWCKVLLLFFVTALLSSVLLLVHCRMCQGG
jgi:hypothetical protein